MRGHVTPLLKSTADNQLEDEEEEEEEEEEETLSLRDFPLNSSSPVDHQTTTYHSRRSSSPDFFFQFLIDDERQHLITSFADDVIFRGRLLPFFNPPPPRRSLSLSSVSTRLPRRCDESHSPENRMIRPSRSLDCRKLGRNSSAKNELRSESKGLPWYWLMFGLPVKIPAGMEINDLKKRQFRRSNPPARLFSDGSSSASWRFLSVLCCRSHASVDVKHGVVSKSY